MESYSGRLMEKVSQYGYVVTVEERDRHGLRWNVYSIIADSYMDLIAGIDSIQSSDDLNWGDHPNYETEDLDEVSLVNLKENGKQPYIHIEPKIVGSISAYS